MYVQIKICSIITRGTKHCDILHHDIMQHKIAPIIMTEEGLALKSYELMSVVLAYQQGR